MIRPLLHVMLAVIVLWGATQLASAREASGTVVDAVTGRPVPDAIVTIGDRAIPADAAGRFRVDTTTGTLGVRAVGYRRAEVNLSRELPAKIPLVPFVPKALYLSVYGVGNTKLRDAALNLIRATQLNALVIDLKSERGIVAYPSAIPLAAAIGAQRTIMIPDLRALVGSLHRQGIYVIARIVVCRDDLLASAHPELAARTRAGGIYRDQQDMRWVDPAQPAVRDYNLAIAVEAARAGFDEIQYDYLRFPDANDVRLPDAATEPARTGAIDAFLDAARARLAPYNVFLAMDVFGYVCWNPSDLHIGQRLENILARVDYLSPMLYPSGFTFGIPACTNPVAHVHEIVQRSLQQVLARTRVSPLRIRPWLQAFKDYAFDRREFAAGEISQQIRAAEEVGTDGWMLWNARNAYSDRGLVPDTSLPATDPESGSRR